MGQMLQEVALNLYNLRVTAGYDRNYVAQQLGVTYQAVYQWETGLRIPRINNLIPLADFYGVSVDWILRHKIKATKIEITGDELLNRIYNTQ
jgi:transcriptional regulator with XRE-family HTH domain